MSTDLQVVKQIAEGKMGLDNARHLYPSFAKAFFADEVELNRIYGKDTAEVYLAKAKVMVQMDLFHEDESIRDVANVQEAQRTSHAVLERLVDHTDIDIKKILKHMGIPNFPVSSRPVLKVMISQARTWL